MKILSRLVIKRFRKITGTLSPRTADLHNFNCTEEKTVPGQLRPATLTAQNGAQTTFYDYGYGPPSVTLGLKWFNIEDEEPEYYETIHIWDGKSLNIGWARVWSEELEQSVYVNNRDDRVISKITHWAKPTIKNEVNEYPQRTIQDIIDEIRSNRDLAQSFDRVAGYNTAIDIIKKHTHNTT